MRSTDTEGHDEFAQRLDYFITANYESRAQFSTAIGVPQTTVAAIFGKRASSPSKDFFVRLRRLHPECDLNWLITGDRSVQFAQNPPSNVETSRKKEKANVSSNIEEMLSEMVELFKTGIKVKLDQ
jgi:hypothetical protein